MLECSVPRMVLNGIFDKVQFPALSIDHITISITHKRGT